MTAAAGSILARSRGSAAYFSPFATRREWLPRSRLNAYPHNELKMLLVPVQIPLHPVGLKTRLGNSVIFARVDN